MRKQPAHGLKPGSVQERELVANPLRGNGSCVSASSRALGVSRVTFYRMMERNHLALEWSCTVHYAPPLNGFVKVRPGPRRRPAAPPAPPPEAQP